MSIPDWYYNESRSRDLRASRDYKKAVFETIINIRRDLENGANETTIQNQLKNCPYVLGGGYRLGHGTFIYPEFLLPPEYRVDWLVASGSSA